MQSNSDFWKMFLLVADPSFRTIRTSDSNHMHEMTYSERRYRFCRRVLLSLLCLHSQQYLNVHSKCLENRRDLLRIGAYAFTSNSPSVYAWTYETTMSSLREVIMYFSPSVSLATLNQSLRNWYKGFHIEGHCINQLFHILTTEPRTMWTISFVQ